MKPIPVDLGNGDRGALDTLTACRQGLLVLLLDGRVYLVPISYDDALQTVDQWNRGAIGELTLRPPYAMFNRTVVH